LQSPRSISHDRTTSNVAEPCPGGRPSAPCLMFAAPAPSCFGRAVADRGSERASARRPKVAIERAGSRASRSYGPSKYRRVLEYFDAVKDGLTATPTLRTVQIFGEPIFTYSYREAVNRWLFDRSRAADPHRNRVNPRRHHLPERRAARNLRYAHRQGRPRACARRNQVRSRLLQPARHHPEFNRVIAEELAKHIDPSLPGKTLVFASTRCSMASLKVCSPTSTKKHGGMLANGWTNDDPRYCRQTLESLSHPSRRRRDYNEYVTELPFLFFLRPKPAARTRCRTAIAGAN
jgi:hypothetical protein